MSLSPAGALCLIQGYNPKEALVQGDEKPCTRMSHWCFLRTFSPELCRGLAISGGFHPVTGRRMVSRTRKSCRVALNDIPRM
jgi:hypothetical protein